MSGSPTPDRDHRPLKPLLDPSAPAGPPEWLDANIRAAAHDAARKAAGSGAARPAGPDASPPAPRRWRWGWGPAATVAAVAVLGLLIVINRPRQAEDPAQIAMAPATRASEEARAPTAPAPPSAATVPQAAKADAAAAGGAGDLASERARDADRPKLASSAEAKRSDERRQGTSIGANSTTSKSELAKLPDTAQKCEASVEELRRERKLDDARRRLRDCRARYPEHEYPAQLLRELGIPPP